LQQELSWSCLAAALLFLVIAFAGGSLSALPVQTSLPPFDPDVADVVFQHLEASAGVASPVVTSFAEDGDGFLWVGGQSGLQRWDGYRFWTYKLQLGVANSLPDNFVQTLYTDPQGRLWIGTSSGGLARYDREHDKFVRYASGSADLRRVNIQAITGDGFRGLWLGSDNGLTHVDADTGTFTPMELAAPEPGRQRARNVTSIVRGADGTLWIGTDLGLERSVAGGPFEHVPVPAKNGDQQVNKLFFDRGGTLWIGTQHGAYVLDPSGTTTAHSVGAKGPGSDLLATERILSFAQTPQGDVWVGTQDRGVLAVTPAAPRNAAAHPAGGDASGPGAQVRQISHNVALQTSISDDWIQELFLGRSGTMWVATHRGVNYIDTAPKPVSTVRVAAGLAKANGDVDVYSMMAARDGNIWLGLTKGGIDILDPAGHPTGRIQSAEAGLSGGVQKDALPAGTISALAQARDGTVYIGTQQGLYRTLPSSPGEGRVHPRVARLPIGPADSALVQVLPDNGVLWIGGSDGVWRYDPSGKSGLAQRPPMRERLTDQRITVLYRGTGSDLWIGTQNGLNRYDVATGRLEDILPDSADPEALGAGMISTLLTDKHGRLWVGTFSGGVDVLDHRDENGRPRFRRILDGLPNENIDMLLQARDGNIWASTDGGLAVIDPDTLAIQVMGPAEGADIPAYWNSVGMLTANGDILFGGIGGMSVVHPGLVKPWTYQPPVVVTGARIGAFDIPPSRFNSGLDVYPVWIPANANNLTLEFAALDYTAPERNRYAYKLDGFDPDWISAGRTQRVVRYTNLPPGDYILELRGSNRDGMWAPIRKVRIRVLPTWYQKTWVRLFAALAGLLALAGLFQLGTAYLRRQQRELERQVARRTAELKQMTVELTQSQHKLQQIAYTDSLTGLPNRRMFTEQFRRLIALKKRQGGIFALLLMDFDCFKEINDTHGHDAGDAVLREMAARMNRLVRESDCLARLGGDEFGLLLAESPDTAATEEVCRKIIECFTDPVVFQGVELHTSPSIGVALYPLDGDSQDTLYKMADMAMYQAKRGGGNSCSWCGHPASSFQVQ
jgi:diguanylate cyclase (GGDEF)-like protein